MAVELLASDVVIVEEEPQFSSLPSIPTAVLGGVGVTEYGPFGATLTTSMEEWTEIFGGLTANSELTLAAMGFFSNGGATFWGVRTVHYTDPADPLTRTSARAEVNLVTTGAATQGSAQSGNQEPFNLDPGDTLSVETDLDGGSPFIVTFDAAPASFTGTGGTYPTLWAAPKTLELKVDEEATAQVIDFPGSSLSLAQVIDEINPQLVGGHADDNGGQLRLTSDKKGTGSKIEITGGTGLTELGLSVSDSDVGTGDVVDIDAVTALEAKTRIEGDSSAQVTVETDGSITLKTPTVGPAGWIRLATAGSTAHTAAKFDFVAVLDTQQYGSAAGPGNMGKVLAKWEGGYGDNLDAVVSAATNGDGDFFNLQVLENSVAVEAFPNVITDPTHPRYWVTVVNANSGGSLLVTAEDLGVGSPPANRPDNGTYSLTGGDDGLVGLVDNDFVGSPAGPTGLYELDAVENLTLLIVPGQATAYVHQSMLAYCETWREGQVFAILDSPAGMSATEIVTYVKTTAAIKELSEFGAIYWPRIRINNPDDTLYTSDADGMITVAPAGYLAGVFARTDGARPGGIYDPPAGPERGIIYNCLGFETDETLDKRKRDLVYPERINPLTTWSGVPRHIDGTYTLKSSGPFPTVAERRGVSNIERTIKIGLSFARHANNTRKLRRRCHRTVFLYLVGEMQKGAFRSEVPAEAFNVDFSDRLNPPNVVFAQQLRGRISLATNKPINWVILSIAQDTRAIDQQLAELAQGRA